MAETVTGTTVGDVKYVVAYFDVNTNNLYDASGNLFGNNTLTSYLDNEFTLELHYVQDISTSSNPEEWAVWDGLKDLTVSSTLAFDDNYLHAVKGTIVADAEAGSPSVSVDVTDDINKDTLSRYGVLLVNPFGDEEDQLMIPYSSFQQVSGTTFSFVVDDVQGLEASVTKDTPVRVSDPLYMFINANDIYEANIPNRYEEGVFKFPVNVMSRKLLNALDYSGSTGVSGTMEHKIYTNKTNVVGVNNKNFTPPLPLDRNQELDEVADLREFAGIKTTVGGNTVYPRYAEHDTEHDEESYYAWMNTENETVAFYTKTTDVTVGTLLYDELYFTQLTETVSALVYEVNPYLFCGWNSGILKYWTKGNDVKENDYFYNISGGTATIGNAAASPVYETEPILFRTFAFPFIVRNLVDYGVSLTIPTEDIDWTKEYVISIIRNNMEEVTGKASKGAYGVVRIGENIEVTEDISGNTNGIISVPIASTSKKGVVKVDGTTFTVNATTGLLSIASASTSDKGIVQIVDDISDTTSTDKATTPNYVDDRIETSIATVEEVVKGTTGSNIVDADGLTGALSLGQAVDVSCPVSSFGSYSSVQMTVNGEVVTYTAATDAGYKANYLNAFTATATNVPASTERAFGFTSSYPFPKFAPGFKYLFIADVQYTGTATLSMFRFFAPGTTNWKVGSIPRDLPDRTPNKPFVRLATLAYIAQCYLAPKTAANSTGTVSWNVKNFRAYEVTNLTDEAIEYLAHYGEPVYDTTTTPPTLISHGSPDDLFRNPDIHSDTATTNPHPSVLSRYLIKQDMVAPWIPTINMPDNSAGLTVGAGLSYKIKYTKTGTYSVTVDTIPTDAYGWDAHIQMFVKDTAIVQFQAPLILMDALTPNSGHNLSVKFRNGNALVYVDDTNAGTMVYLATGTTTTVGSLPYALSQTPSSEDATFTNFVVFSPELNGTVCSIGTMSNVAYSASLIGNSDDETIIGGTIGLASGKYLAVQDVNLNDLTITSGTLNIGNNVKVTGTTTAGVTGSGTGSIVLDEGCLLDFSDQANNVPITGASISAVSGARAIPYGGEESEVIGVGTGNAVNKYGKVGYLVSDASATTGANTLYDALMGGGTAYSNAIFDSALDGITVSLAENTAVSKFKSVYGNGVSNTTINFNQINFPSGFNYLNGTITLNDMTVTGSNTSSSPLSFQNVSITGMTNHHYQENPTVDCIFTIYYDMKNCVCVNNHIPYDQTDATKTRSFIAVRGDLIRTIENCTFEQSYSDYTKYCLFDWNTIDAVNQYLSIKNCTFNNTGIAIFLQSGKTKIDSCLFTGNDRAINARYVGCTISGSTFATSTDNIVTYADITVTFEGTNILNSTVSGAGTVAFANGATVTSTIPSGSTIGTGVIARSIGATSDVTCTIENITISTATNDGVPLLVGGNSNILLKNCMIANNAQRGFRLISCEQATSQLTLEDCRFENNSIYDYSVYAANGLTTLKNVTALPGLIGLFLGTVVIDGSCYLRGIEKNATKQYEDIYSNIIIKPNATLMLRNAVNIGGSHGVIAVGNYVNGSYETSASYTATVIFKNSSDETTATLTISGGTTGQILDLTGLHN